MKTTLARAVLIALVPTFVGCASSGPATTEPSDREVLTSEPELSDVEPTMQVHYLEIVTPDVDATCAALAGVHGVTFDSPVPEFGNARTAALDGGGLLGVRAPMRPDEDPIVRPYVLVEDLDAAVEAAEAAGGTIALPPMEIPGRGRFAIYILGGINHGLWQI